MDSRARFAALIMGCAAFGLTLPAAAQAPLSAIDWLSQSVIEAPEGAPRNEAPIIGSGDALPQNVIVSVLDGPSPDAAGLLPPSKTGLPQDLWGIGRAKDIAATLSAERADVLPALQSLLLTILLAEAAPPADIEKPGDLVLARIDKLLSMGALHQAEALIETVTPMTAEVFRRRFDVAMLTGTEDAACQDLRAAPDLAPTYPARVFCLARSGDWNAAALTLRMAQALGYVSPEEDALLSRFLDPDLFEGEPLLVPPQPMTPLVWRMLESIGEGIPTGSLPLAFSHAELRETAGWKAQIEAAERLTRAGALPPNQLLGIYTERLPAASGGVWDRVEAFQRFETALRTGDPGAVARYLPTVWAEMGRAELEVPFAALFADDLIRLPLPAAESALAFRIALLSPDYERAASQRSPADATELFLIGVARGSLLGVTPPDSLARAIAPAFLRATPPPDLKTLLDEDRLGESLLAAIDRIARGLTGDLRGVTDGLALLRQVGLEDVARRTALQVLLLERRG
jgi:hypothetical protein